MVGQSLVSACRGWTGLEEGDGESVCPLLGPRMTTSQMWTFEVPEDVVGPCECHVFTPVQFPDGELTGRLQQFSGKRG